MTKKCLTIVLRHYNTVQNDKDTQERMEAGRQQAREEAKVEVIVKKRSAPPLGEVRKVC